MSCGTPNEFPLVEPDEGSTPKPTIIIAGPGIDVDDLSDSTAYRFIISAEEYVALSATLVMVAKEGIEAQFNPVLKGTIINVLEFDWTFNKEVVSQELNNSSIVPEPVLLPEDRAYDYTPISITTDITFTITANDGNGQPGSIASDSESIVFGNNMLFGSAVNFNLKLLTDFLTIAEDFTKVVKTSRPHIYYATGGANQHHYVMYPKVWGLGVFKKGIFEGGYVRLKNVGGTLKQTLGVGDVESDIEVENEKGFVEAYYVYMSLYDNQVDATTPFVLS